MSAVGTYEHHVTDAVKVKHIVAGGLRLVTKVVGGGSAGTYYPHGDHLGSLHVLTTSAGTELQRLPSRPVGATHTNQGTKDCAKHRFTGQEEDPETGLYYYHARYYNPVLGRFISPDSLVPEPGNPQSLNRYSYVENTPVNRIDPTGHWSLGKFLTGLFAKVVGIFVNPMASIFVEAGVTRAMNGGSDWRHVGTAAVSQAAAVAAIYVSHLASEVVAAALSGTAPAAGGASGAAGEGSGVLLAAAVVDSQAPALATAVGHVSGAAVGGFVHGMGGRLVTGAGWQEALRAGYQTALIGAIIMTVAEAAGFLYRWCTGCEPDPSPGGEALTKGPQSPPDCHSNNVGFAGDPRNPGFFGEGSPLSRTLNAAFTGNAWAKMHDVLQNLWGRLGEMVGLGPDLLRNALNVPGVPVAAGFTYPALLSRCPVCVTVGLDGEADRNR